MQGMQQPPTADGPRVAWMYFRLALRALFAPVLVPLAMRIGPQSDRFLRWLETHQIAPAEIYLLLNAGLYGYAALAFLARIPGLTAGRTGLAVVDDPLMHALWGVAVLIVCLSQLAALVSAHLRRMEWTVWRISAVLTAMWAMAYWIVVILVSFEVHSYGGILIWGWVVGIHLLFVRNHPAPLDAARTPSAHQQRHHLSPQEEAELLTRLHTFAEDDDENDKKEADENGKGNNETSGERQRERE